VLYFAVPGRFNGDRNPWPYLIIGMKKMFKNSAQKVLTLLGHFDNMRPHTEHINTTHMRTKTLLITAALAAAGLVSASAQVFSVNAVGYVNVTVPARAGGAYMILANPLNASPNNSVDTILPLPQDGTYDGANVFRFNRSTQQYYETMQFISGAGWLAANESDKIINPGEGFFLQNVAGVPINLTFVGEVPVGASLSQTVQGAFGYNLAGSIVPKGLRLGYNGSPNATLGYPATDGDNAFVFNENTQQYEETYQYIEGAGWLHATDTNTDGPLLNPGRGLFIQRAGATAPWTQSFSVN
jgi:hypothetical protein